VLLFINIFTCTVTGCANPEVPAHAWFSRTADGHGVMGCQHSSDTVSFQCVDGEWRAPYINCSACEHLALGKYVIFKCRSTIYERGLSRDGFLTTFLVSASVS